MSKVVLHIGTHKTATTTIQDTFWENADLLAQHGIVYPRIGRAAGHHGLAFDWGHLPKVYEYDEGSLGMLRKIAEQYGKGDKTVLLSSEELSRGDPRARPDFTAIREALAPFDQIEVVCVLRTQWSFLQSVYLELSKKNSPPRPPMLVEPVIKSGMFAGLWVDYNAMLDRLEESFAPEEITLLDFATLRASEGGVLGAMLRHLGSDLDAGKLAKVNNGMSNASPPSLASWAANLLAEPRPAPPWLVQQTAEAIAAEYGEDKVPCLFLRREFKALKEHFDARNQVLRERRAKVQPDFQISPAKFREINMFRDDITVPFWIRVGRRLTADRL